MAHFDASGTVLGRLLPDEGLEEGLEEQTPPWALEWPVWKLDLNAESSDPKTNVYQALGAAVADVDEPLGVKLGRVEAGKAPRHLRRGSAVGDEQEEASEGVVDHRVVDRPLEVVQAHPLEAETVVDELMLKECRESARRRPLLADDVLDGVGGAQGAEETEELRPLRRRRMNKLA